MCVWPDATAISTVHVDVIGWNEDNDDVFDETSREIERYVLGAHDLGLQRAEIERDLQERFADTLAELELEYASTRLGDIRAIVMAVALVAA